ncbi:MULTISPECIES: methyltransferase domain-containing protein [unclassified Bacillus (in: firmicutes)]|uniref:class I SAM-dependent methyltransferase n=1 Tax=unclassified Bacillus (in: firmicutes) TaxID=185979 RepID=UPI001BE79C08|nr:MULTISPECIES: methyltransferase domain-containing protein [unclassified Bacillus (in: firmicutes)]MBT2638020.1 methyltransferase domain-containing protein [Bacillus sp. ISL-39]MBT2661195.1 methyltransferase domain-containing protein [Bacillus sp. ISL-45]
MDRLIDGKPPEPNRRLLRMAAYLKGGTAIDFASGLGGNSIYLSELGYDMTAVDISDVAINYVQAEAARRGLNITAKVTDLTKERSFLKDHKHDLAVMTYYLDRSVFPLLKQVIKDNGYLFFETFYKHKTANNGHISSQYKLESNELLKELGDWKILFFEEDEQEGRQTIFCQKKNEFQ